MTGLTNEELMVLCARLREEVAMLRLGLTPTPSWRATVALGSATSSVDEPLGKR